MRLLQGHLCDIYFIQCAILEDGQVRQDVTVCPSFRMIPSLYYFSELFQLCGFKAAVGRSAGGGTCAIVGLSLHWCAWHSLEYNWAAAM